MYGAVLGAGLTCSAIGGVLGAKLLGVLVGHMQAQNIYRDFGTGKNEELDHSIRLLKMNVIKQVNDQPKLFSQVKNIDVFAITEIEGKLTQVIVSQSITKFGKVGLLAGLTYGVTSGAICSFLGFGAVSSVALSILTPVGLGLGAAAVIAYTAQASESKITSDVVNSLCNK